MGNRESSTAVDARSSLIYFVVGAGLILAFVCLMLLGLGERIISSSSNWFLYLAAILGQAAFLGSPYCFWKGYHISRKSVAGRAKLFGWLNALGMAAWTCGIVISMLDVVLRP